MTHVSNNTDTTILKRSADVLISTFTYIEISIALDFILTRVLVFERS